MRMTAINKSKDPWITGKILLTEFLKTPFLGVNKCFLTILVHSSNRQITN